VYAGFDLARWKPKMLIVELQDYHLEFVGIEAIREPIARLRRDILEPATPRYMSTQSILFFALCLATPEKPSFIEL
jgi:hypothetical protein